MGIKKIFQSFDFRNNKIINAKTNLPTHEDHVIPAKYVNERTTYNTAKVNEYVNPFKLDWVTNPLNKTFLQLFDDIFFPRILPVYNNPEFEYVKVEPGSYMGVPVLYQYHQNNTFMITWKINNNDRLSNGVTRLVVTKNDDSILANIPFSSSANEGYFNNGWLWRDIKKVELVRTYNPTTVTKQDSYGDDYVDPAFETVYELRYDVLADMKKNFFFSGPLLWKRLGANDDVQDKFLEVQDVINNGADVDDLVTSHGFIRDDSIFMNTTSNAFIVALPQYLIENYVTTFNDDVMITSFMNRDFLFSSSTLGTAYYLFKVDFGWFATTELHTIKFK